MIIPALTPSYIGSYLRHTRRHTYIAIRTQPKIDHVSLLVPASDWVGVEQDRISSTYGSMPDALAISLGLPWSGVERRGQLVMQCKLVHMRGPVVKERNLLSSGLRVSPGRLNAIRKEEVGSAYMYQSVGRRSS